MVSPSAELIFLLAWVALCWAIGIPQQRIAMRELPPEQAKTTYGWMFAKTARGRRAARLALLAYVLAAAGAIA
jgi:hypothetical protein